MPLDKVAQLCYTVDSDKQTTHERNLAMCHWKNTPYHGYLHLSPSELERIPEIARRPFYEEDCEYSIAVTALPEIVYQKSYGATDPEESLKHARTVCRDWYPDIYAALTGENVTAENSRTLREQEFYKSHASDFLAAVAFGDWKEGVSPGMVHVCAIRGENQERACFEVPKEEYRNRSNFTFVIDTNIHKMVKEV